MPACFSLTKVGESSPSNLNDVDREICKFLDVPLDEKMYCAGWYNVIGFKLATGSSPNEIRSMLYDWIWEQCEAKKPDLEAVRSYTALLKIMDFLQENYSHNSWYERK